MNRLSSFYLEVYGCQMNVHDSEIMAGVLTEAGMSAAESPELADVILVVSCAVRETAETRALGRAAQLCGLKGREGLPLVGVCGCVAREHGADLLARLPALDLVVGPDSYRELPRFLAGEGGGCSVEFRPESYDGIVAVRRDFPRSFVTVMRGCDNRCSYCIVPQVRGPERSRAAQAVLDEVAQLAAEGYGEITLLGQNVNSYRDGEVDFPRLLEMAAQRAAPAWIRFVTSHPRDFGPRLARAMAQNPNVCPQLHLPVQSGSDRVLAAMGRGYTVREYMERVAIARGAVPHIVLSTDVIAGFPGETEDDFRRTEELLRRVRYDYAFLFRYSERSGTRAAEMEDALPVEERLRRLRNLQRLQRSITTERSRALVGREMDVLVTGSARRPGQQAARSPGNRMVVMEGTRFDPGARVRVRVERADGWTHFALPV